MIRANELRIGNYLQNYKGDLRVIQLLDTQYASDTHIMGWGVGSDRAFGSGDDSLLPIELNEEWMLKFGFTYSDLNGDSGHWQMPFFEILDGEEGFCYDYTIYIKHVHQLQNLYFALTGEELVINEKEKV